MDKDIQHGKYRTHNNHDNARHEAFRASGYKSVVDHLLGRWDTLSLMPSTTKRRGLCKPNILWHLPIKKGVWRIRAGMAPHCFPQLLRVRFALSQCVLREVSQLFMILTFHRIPSCLNVPLPRLYLQRGVNLDRESEGDEQRSKKRTRLRHRGPIIPLLPGEGDTRSQSLP